MSRVTLKRGRLKAALDHLPSEQAVTISNLATSNHSGAKPWSVVHRTDLQCAAVTRDLRLSLRNGELFTNFALWCQRRKECACKRGKQVTCEVVGMKVNSHSVLLLKQAMLLLRKFTNSGTNLLESRIY